MEKKQYLQLEICHFAVFWRFLSSIDEVFKWYIHLVKNPRRAKRDIFKLVTRVPRNGKQPEYCVIDMQTGKYVSRKEIFKRREY